MFLLHDTAEYNINIQSFLIHMLSSALTFPDVPVGGIIDFVCLRPHPVETLCVSPFRGETALTDYREDPFNDPDPHGNSSKIQ